MAAPRKQQSDGRPLDWRGSSGGGKQGPCMHCGNLSFLRHPVVREWAHKVCAEEQFPQQPAGQ